MPHSTTGKTRVKRPDNRPNSKVRRRENQAEAKAMTADELRIVKKPKKDQGEREVIAAAAPLKESTDDRVAKKIKALNKKLTAIEALKDKQKAGVELDEQQLAKVESLADTLQELEDFMEGRRT